MVKVKPFRGAVFSPQDYQILLKNNIEHLEPTPMSKTFNTQEMLATGRLHPEQDSFFYIYRQVYKDHTSFGLLAEISLKDYHQNKIKRHEKTLKGTHLNPQTINKDHIGPVVVSYRQDIQLKALINNLIKQQQQFSSWTTSDGREHTLWRVQKQAQAISANFGSIDNLYILDGHHRLEAAHQNYLNSEKRQEKDEWIQALIFSSEYVVVHPQHRVIQNISGNNNIRSELEKIKSLYITNLEDNYEEHHKIQDLLDEYEIVLKEYDHYYGINFKNTSRNTLEKVPSARLQSEIFFKFLDQNLFKDVQYIPGIVDPESISQNDVVFYVREPQLETIFQIADENGAMPPKSTWIQPKPCSHMVIRLP